MCEKKNAIGFIFDLDGTLLDDVHLIREIPEHLAKEFGKSISEEEMVQLREQLFETLSDTGSKWLVVKSILFLARKMGIPWYKHLQFLRKAKQFYLSSIRKCQTFEGVEEVISEIRIKQDHPKSNQAQYDSNNYSNVNSIFSY